MSSVLFVWSGHSCPLLLAATTPTHVETAASAVSGAQRRPPDSDAPIVAPPSRRLSWGRPRPHSRHHHNSRKDSRLGCPRSEPTPKQVWNGHSRPLAFDVDVDLLLALSQHLSFRPEPDPERSRRGRRSGGTCCPPAVPQLMWRQPPRPSADRSDAHAERILPSAAFDVELDAARVLTLAECDQQTAAGGIASLAKNTDGFQDLRLVIGGGIPFQVLAIPPHCVPPMT